MGIVLDYIWLPEVLSLQRQGFIVRNLGVALDSSHFVLVPQHPFVSKFWFIQNIPWAHALSSPSHLFTGCYPKLSSVWACLAAFGSPPFQPIICSVKLSSKSDHAPSLTEHLIGPPLPTEWRRTPDVAYQTPCELHLTHHPHSPPLSASPSTSISSLISHVWLWQH